jgi:PIN domain nuclease of toxin-antitoxin system
MDLLLDTHVFLWWDGADHRLGKSAQTAIADPANKVFISAASVWEIAIKRARGKLRFTGSAQAAIARNGFFPLSIAPAHAEAAGATPWDHADPFDRMLVAQSIAQSLVLVHADQRIRDYDGVSQLWAGA